MPLPRKCLPWLTCLRDQTTGLSESCRTAPRDRPHWPLARGRDRLEGGHAPCPEVISVDGGLRNNYRREPERRETVGIAVIKARRALFTASGEVNTFETSASSSTRTRSSPMWPAKGLGRAFE